MESKAKLFGHPIHQMLIVFPLGLLATSVFFDVAYLLTGNERWSDVSYSMISVGIVTGLLAAVFGIIDWAAIPKGTRAKRVGTLHGVGNGVVLLFFIMSWQMRTDLDGEIELGAFALSLIAVCCSMVTAWLGGELVNRHGVGVYDDAALDAPSSLSYRHTHASQVH